MIVNFCIKMATNYRKRQNERSHHHDDPNQQSEAANLADELKHYFRKSKCGRKSDQTSSCSSLSPQQLIDWNPLDNSDLNWADDTGFGQPIEVNIDGHDSETDDDGEEVQFEIVFVLNDLYYNLKWN